MMGVRRKNSGRYRFWASEGIVLCYLLAALSVFFSTSGCGRSASQSTTTPESPSSSSQEAQAVDNNTPKKTEAAASDSQIKAPALEPPAKEAVNTGNTQPVVGEKTQSFGLPTFSAPALTIPSPSVSPGANPVVEIETSLGSFQIELDRQKAPITVENFLGYVERGQYDRTIVHQVFPRSVVVFGAYKLGGEPVRPGPPIMNESGNGLKNLRGTVAMFRDPGDPHSATSVFFVNVKDNPQFDRRPEADQSGGLPRGKIPPEDFGYCVFGRVIRGMEVVDKIAEVPIQDTDQLECTPVQTIIVRSIRCIK